MRTTSILVALGLTLTLAPSCGGGSSGDCVIDSYPEAPAGAAGALHVSASCPAEGADGSAAHPYPTMSAAIAESAAGGVILVAPGTYAENLAIDKDLTIVGPAKAGMKGEEAGIILQAPQPNAILVTGGATASLSGFHVTAPQSVGVYAKGGHAHVTSCKVEGAKASAGGTLGHAFASAADGAIILQDSAAVSSEGIAVLVTGATGSINACSITDSGGAGVRVDKATAPVTITDTRVERSVGFGVFVFGSPVTLSGNTIADTGPAGADFGYGVVALGELDAANNVLTSAALEGSDNVITGSARVGVLCHLGAGGIILQNNTISGTGSKNRFGAGIWIQDGAGGDAGNKIVGNTLTGNRFAGLGLRGETHGIILQNNTVTGTILETFFKGTASPAIGDGISLFDGATASLAGNTASMNGRFGVTLDNAGAGVTFDQNTITDNDQYGIILQNTGAAPDLSSNDLSGNKLGAQGPAGMMFDVQKDAFATP